MYDPFILARAVERQVVSGNKRKYYRFRPSKYYGGIFTADAVGCNLRCIFCWSYRYVSDLTQGAFYSSHEVAKRLAEGAIKHGFSRVRISGAEPTIGREHLISVLEEVPPKLGFILETNGLLIDEDYAKELSRFRNLHVRVSLKGTNPSEFSKLTGARPEFFQYQIRGVRNLVEAGVSVHVSAVVSFTTKDSLLKLLELLAGIDESLAESFEPEVIVLYEGVRKRLYSNNIFPKIALTPEGKLITRDGELMK